MPRNIHNIPEKPGFLRTIAQGFAQEGGELKANWKFAIGIVAFVIFMFVVVVPALAFLGFLGLKWIVTHIPKGVNDWFNHHNILVAYSMLGAMVLFALVYSAYQTGKKKLEGNV